MDDKCTPSNNTNERYRLMDNANAINLKESTNLKLAMRLVLEYMRNVPEDKRNDYMMSPEREMITYPDAVRAVESITDAI